MIDQQVGTLSGGERARLSLLRLILEKHNTLLLDEPTNHLDVDAREALEEALATFTGTLVCVSHDRYFLNRIVNRIVAFEGKSGGGSIAASAAGGGIRLRQILGNYDDYRRRILAEREAKQPAAPPPTRPPASPGAGRGGSKGGRPSALGAAPSGTTTPARKRDLGRNELTKLRREVGDLEEEIALIELELEAVSANMSSGALAASELLAASSRAAQLQARLSEKMQRWEVVSALLERDVTAPPGTGHPKR
jgi:ATP-binding cassette subfamily F protein 3